MPQGPQKVKIKSITLPKDQREHGNAYLNEPRGWNPSFVENLGVVDLGENEGFVEKFKQLVQ